MLIKSNALGALAKWQRERGHVAGALDAVGGTGDVSEPYTPLCERIIVFNKRDLVPGWGIEVRRLV